MINFKNLKLEKRPFPHGVFYSVFSENVYKKLVEDFPVIQSHLVRSHYGGKINISEEEKNSKSIYYDILKRSDVYCEFYKYIKSKSFIYNLFDRLEEDNVDLQKKNLRYNNLNYFSRFFMLRKKIAALKNKLLNSSCLSARFEFSCIKLDGEKCLNPHTDSPQKIISLIVPILSEDDINELEGINLGTSIYDVNDDKYYFNQCNRFLTINDVKEIKQLEFIPNSMNIIIKTFNSLHGVKPNFIKGKERFRRSLTINIEIVK